MPWGRAATPAIVCLLLLSRAALGQVPTATGRTIPMSNAAWSLFIPDGYIHRPGAAADLVVHFHGDPATYRNNAKYAGLNALIVTVNYGGLSSAYQTPFQNDTNLFNTLVSEALAKARQQPDFPDNLAWDRLAVSTFSAGYGAVREILKQPSYYGEIDAIVAADSIYAGFVAYPSNLSLVSSQMVDWRRYAADAKAGSKWFLVSHSQVDPVTYASTVLTANDLMSHVGLAPTSVNYNGLGTLNFYRRAQSGQFTVLGATGADGDAHLEHLRYVGEYLRDLPVAKVPEPSAAVLAATATGMLAVRRRRRIV